MRTFKDRDDRQWELAVNVATVKRLRDQLGVDLVDGEKLPELIQRLQADPVLLVDVVYVVCRHQADQRGMTDEQFGAAMAGDAIFEAWTQLAKEITDFFPDRQQREAMRMLLERGQSISDRVMKQQLEKLRTRIESGEIDRAVEKMIADHETEQQLKQMTELRIPSTHGERSTASPESSASTPDP